MAILLGVAGAIRRSTRTTAAGSLAICGYICFFTGVPDAGIPRACCPNVCDRLRLRVAHPCCLPWRRRCPTSAALRLWQKEVLDLALRRVICSIRFGRSPTGRSSSAAACSSCHSPIGPTGLLALIVLVHMGARQAAQDASINPHRPAPAAGEPGRADAHLLIGPRCMPRPGSARDAAHADQRPGRRAARFRHRQPRWSSRTIGRTRPATTCAMSTGPPTRGRTCWPCACTARRSRRASTWCSMSAARWRSPTRSAAPTATCRRAGLRVRVDGRRLARHHVAGDRAASRCTRPEDIERLSACDATMSALEGGPPAAPPPVAARHRQRLPVSARCRRAGLAAGARQRVARDRATHPARRGRAGVEGGRRLVDVEGHGELDLVHRRSRGRATIARDSTACAWACRAPPAASARRSSTSSRDADSRRRASTGGSRRAGAGMIFTTPLGLLALLAIPAIVAIHLFRRRFPVRPVAGLFLWQTRATDAGRRRPNHEAADHPQPDPGVPCSACARADSRRRADLSRGRQPASRRPARRFCVDGGGNARGESARDRAVRRILAELGRLRSGARVTLMRSGDRPAILLGPAALRRRSAGRRSTPGRRRRRIIRWRSACVWRANLRAAPARLMVMSDMPPAPRGEPRFEGGALGVARRASRRTSALPRRSARFAPEDGRRRRVADAGEQRRCRGEPAPERARRRHGSACTGARACRPACRRCACRFRPGCRPFACVVGRCAAPRQRRRARRATAADRGDREPAARGARPRWR